MSLAVMPLSITYQLTGVGWSECVVTDGQAKCELTASYLSDALEKLVLAAFGLLSGFRAVTFSFDEEPGEYRWVIQDIDINEIRIEILAFDELWGNKPDASGKLLFSTNCRPVVFATAVQQAATTVLAKHGEQGYREKWCEHPFPTRELKLLTELVARCE